MEIIHVILDKTNPERMNGVNKVVHQLATQQHLFGEQVAVWGITSDTTVNYNEQIFETLLFPKLKNPFAFSTQLKEALFSKKGKAIFHLHGGWIPIYYRLVRFFYNNKIEFVITPHGAYNTIAMRKNFWLKKIYFQLFERKILKRALRIHCIGKSERNGLQEFYRSQKIILLPYGFELKSTIALKKRDENLFVFGFIGRLDIYTKGLDTLLLAFKRFHRKMPQAQLWIVGDGKEKPTLEKKINALKLNHCLILYGSKFGSEKEQLLQAMDVFIHPSRNEGLPLSVIEAASFGKPCIVTDATNIGYLITKYNAGQTIYRQSSKQLEAAMHAVVAKWSSPSTFVELQQNAIRMIKENYNWNTLLQQYHQQLYKLK